MSGDDTLDELDLLARAAASTRGAALFPALAQHLARALNASETQVCEAIHPDRVHTLAVFADGRAAPNYEYGLAGTPSVDVLSGRVVHLESIDTTNFPRTSPGRAGYLGLPLISSAGEVFGFLCAYTDGPMNLTARQRVFCEVLASRAAAELQLLRLDHEQRRLQTQNQYLREEINSLYNFDEIIGSSPGLVRVLQNVSRVAATDATVLISGETGTGKELIARAVHSASRRAELPFIKFNCAALAADDIEEKLFGPELSRFELANGGTIFLDEIGELKPDTQEKLLRVMRDQTLEIGGQSAPVKLDVRVVAATNRDLRKAVRDGEFRDDLYQALNVLPIELPPLRARAEDIAPLVHYFAHKYAPRVGRRVDGVDPDTLAALTRYPWPGNVRELENLVERALILNTSPMLKIPPEMLALYAPDDRGEMAAAATGMYRLPVFQPPGAATSFDNSEITGLHHVQREHILRVLNATHWIIEGHSGAALKLGMKPATLRHRMKKLGISRAQAQPGA